MNRDPVRTKRKVQQMGSSTLAVTVPADWARQHEIEKGDELVVQRDEKGSSLLLVPERPSIEDREATIDGDELDADALGRAVVTQYVLGRQLVRVTCDPDRDAHRRAVLDAERRLMGLGIVEDGPDRVTVRCSVAPENFDLPTLLGRLGRTEAMMRENAVAAFVDDDADAARQVVDRRDQIEKLFYLFSRLVFAAYRNPRLNHAVGLESGFPLVGFQSVARDAVSMADVAVDVATLVLEGDDDACAPDSDAAAPLAGIGDALAQGIDLTREAVTDPDSESIERARAALERVDDRVAEANAYLEAERPEPLLALQRAITLLERSAGHARDSLSVATHLAFRDSPDLVTSD